MSKKAFEDNNDEAGCTEEYAPRPRQSQSRAGNAIERRYDLAIIGSGSAAFAAAIRASDLGAKVALCEAATIGGTCVNVGCVPSKTLLAAAQRYYEAGHHSFSGISTSAVGFDLAEVQRSKDALISTLRKEKYEDLADGYGFDVLMGHATFESESRVVCGDIEVEADALLVATGASPAVPAIEGLAEADYLTSTTALELTEIPSSLAVIGANAIGLELGQFFLHIGARVSFFEALDRIAPFEEPEISQELEAILTEQGARIVTGARISAVRKASGGYEVVLAAAPEGESANRSNSAHDEVYERILVATGRRPNTAEMNLERAGVKLTERGAIVVDETLRTTNPRIWAAGDATGSPQFVYVAAAQGALAAENALNGSSKSIDWRSLPRVTFTNPPVASVGMTEKEARERGIPVVSRTLALSSVPRALVEHDTRGLFKLVADARDGTLLGAHILAKSAGEVALAAVYAIEAGMSVEDMSRIWAPYLTMAEGLRLAAQSFERDVGRLSCCAA